VSCDVLLLDGSPGCLGGEACLSTRLGLDAPQGCHGEWGHLDEKEIRRKSEIITSQ